MRDEKLSKDWNRSEFRCRCAERGKDWCGGAAPISERLVVLLQLIRDKANVSLFCVHSSNPNAGSGFRCIPYNKSIGGVPDSYHTLGKAADIWSTKISALEIFTIAQVAISELGYGWAKLYPDKNFVHIDIGDLHNADT